MKRLYIVCGLVGLLVLSLFVPTALTAQIDDATEEATVEATSEVNLLPEGVELVEGEIRVLSTFSYEFEAEADEVVTLVAYDLTSALDLNMTLIDTEGDVIAENDNREISDPILSEFDPVIELVEIPEDGTYTVEVTNNFTTEGEFELYIIRGEETTIRQVTQPDFDPNATPTPTPAGPRLSGPCTVSVDFIAARLRSAPTTNASQIGSIQPGETWNVNGRVSTPDGFTWYRLTNYAWVRADAVQSEGACSSVPTF